MARVLNALSCFSHSRSIPLSIYIFVNKFRLKKKRTFVLWQSFLFFHFFAAISHELSFSSATFEMESNQDSFVRIRFCLQLKSQPNPLR